MLGFIRSYLTQKPIFDEPPVDQKRPLPQNVPKPQKVEQPPSEMEQLFGKLAPNLVIEPPIVLLWENEKELPFFKKVAEAVTKFVETAECYPYDEKHFATAKVIVANAHLLGVEPHMLLANPIRLGLHAASEYERNVELKRELWKKLQSISDLLA